MTSNWFTQESDGRKPNWFVLRSFPYQEKYKFHCKLIFQKFSQILVEATQGGNCHHKLPVILFMNWYHVCFLQVLGQMQEFGIIIDNGLTKNSPHISIILMEMSQWTWTLFTFKFLIILMTKLPEKRIELILEFVKYT